MQYLVTSELDDRGQVITTTNCEPLQLHGIIVHLISVLADHAGVEYNELVDELKEIPYGENQAEDTVSE